MRATIRDTYNALTLRNIAVFGAITALAICWVVLLPLNVRRLSTPSLILMVTAMGWQIARTVNEDGLSELINAASVGLAFFAVMLYCGAIFDSLWYPTTGYITGVVQMVLWSWIAVHLGRALSILRGLSPASQQLVTQSTASIVAQMRRRYSEANAALQNYDEVRGLK